jgi:hypothetical protein
MHLRLIPNLLHFLPDLDALYALCCAPNFYEIHPWFNSLFDETNSNWRAYLMDNDLKNMQGE